MNVSSPFDAIAHEYDPRFSHRQVTSWLRAAVHERIEGYLAEVSDILELGCGTGEDALWFGQRGYQVLATDASPAMLEEADAKVTGAGLSECIALMRLDLTMTEISPLPDSYRAQLIFSNFGVLNCIPEPAPVLQLARQHITRGGYLAVCLMGRFCLWETVRAASRGRFRKAVRRWRGRSEYRIGDERWPVWYHSPQKVIRAADGFRRRGLFGIGALLPTSEDYELGERWPSLFARLSDWDRRLAPLLYGISDHYLLVMQKTEDDNPL